MARTLDRACKFGMARFQSADELSVRTHLPPLKKRQLARLPEVLRSSHNAYLLRYSPEDPPGPTAA